MNRSRSSQRGPLLALLIGTTLLAASLVQAQDNPLRTKKVVALTQSPKAEPAKPGDVEEIAIQALVDVDTSYNKNVTDFLNRLIVAQVHDQADEPLGATLQPVGAALRAQLEIPAGQ